LQQLFSKEHCCNDTDRRIDRIIVFATGLIAVVVNVYWQFHKEQEPFTFVPVNIITAICLCVMISTLIFRKANKKRDDH